MNDMTATKLELREYVCQVHLCHANLASRFTCGVRAAPAAKPTNSEPKAGATTGNRLAAEAASRVREE